MIDPPAHRAHRTSLNWPGATKSIADDELLSVLWDLEPKTRRNLAELARALGRSEVSTLVWLMESSFRGVACGQTSERV